MRAEVDHDQRHPLVLRGGPEGLDRGRQARRLRDLSADHLETAQKELEHLEVLETIKEDETVYRPVSAAEGEFRFAIFPRDIDPTLLNFWGAGLFSSMFRAVDPTDESILNCMVGDFAITQGQMTANDFWFDTSRVRAHGKGSVDLTAGTVDMTLRPRPKKRTFLTLATPTKVKGPLEKPRISLTKGGLVGTAFRLYMWWLTVYTQILRKPLPTDGSDVCFLPLPVETVEEPSAVTASPPID